jgi:hypothetical protein
MHYYNFLLFLLTFLTLCSADQKQSPEMWRNVFVKDSLDILVNGSRTGLMTNEFVVDDKSVTSNVAMTVVQNGQTMVDLTEKRVYSLNGLLTKAFQEMKSPSGSSTWKLELNKNLWQLTVTTAGVCNTRTISSVHENLLGTQGLFTGIKKRTIKTGNVWNDTLVELTSGENIITTTRCTEIPSEKNQFHWVFNEENSLQGKLERWELDTNGFTLYHEISPFIAVKPGYTPARQTGESAGSTNLFDAFKVKVEKPPVKGGTVTIILHSTVTLDSSVLPLYKKNGNNRYCFQLTECECKNAQPTALPDSLKQYLKATPTLQVNHPEITSLAKKLSSKSTTVCDKIRSYTDYVARSIQDRNTATFSSAVETVRAGFGDCGEHAVLLAALLRASGIPARVVLGLVYMESRQGFYGHAWVMAYDGTRWLFTDPAHNVFPACYNRIPLLIDDTGQQMIHIIRMLGKIEIECGVGGR